jgi:hypothetical protein
VKAAIFPLLAIPVIAILIVFFTAAGSGPTERSSRPTPRSGCSVARRITAPLSVSGLHHCPLSIE